MAYYGAGTTTTFCATQLGSCEADASEVFQQGYFGVDCVEDNLGAIQVEANAVLILLRNRGKRRPALGRDSWLNQTRCHFGAKYCLKVDSSDEILQRGLDPNRSDL